MRKNGKIKNKIAKFIKLKKLENITTYGVINQ